MLDIISTICIDDIIMCESWAGRWFWKHGTLYIGANKEMADPDANPTFILDGVRGKMSWNLAWEKEDIVGVRFDDPLQLAMRLSEFELVNADQVVKRVKEALANFGND